jgi:hypothetical protein
MRLKLLLSIVTVLAGWFTTGHPAFAQDWTLTSAPANIGWSSISSSADGTKLVAVGGVEGLGAGASYIYTSSDGGTSWMATDPFAVWQSVASSADGSKLVAASFTYWDLVSFGQVYTSTNAGASWVVTSAPQALWHAVACSADGVKLAAAGYSFNPQGDFVYTSTNSGASWIQTSAPDTNWTSVASSADGTKLVAVVGFNESGGNPGGNPIYTSKDSGATWTQTSAPLKRWTCVASSADGSKLVAGWGRIAGTTGGIYVSTDFGVTWTQTSAPSYNTYWSSVASSADGTKLVAACGPGGYSRTYISRDSGTTWTATTPDGVGGPVASSADGSKLAAAGLYVAGGCLGCGHEVFAVCTMQITPTPLLAITPSVGNAAISWTIPSLDFTLQQNSDLTTTNWTDVPTRPVLNLTNLQNQVIVSPTNGDTFYRLKH